MSKLINLIPQQLKDKRKQKQYRNMMVLLGFIPVGIFGQLQFTINGIEKDIEETNSEISKANSLEKEVKNQENALFNDTRIVNGLSNESFPLHRFLLFMSVELPSDIRLFSVTSENVLEQQKAEEEAEETADSEELTEINASENTDDANSETEQGDGTNVNETDENVNKEETNEKESKKEQQKEIEKVEKVLSSQRIIYIRGAALSVKSLGDFMSELEKNYYIDKVDIQDIQNYYNGAESYKFFELNVRTK